MDRSEGVTPSTSRGRPIAFTVLVVGVLLVPLVQACGQPQASTEASAVPGGAGARVAATASSQSSSSTQAPIPTEEVAVTAMAVGAVPREPGGAPTPVPTRGAPLPKPTASADRAARYKPTPDRPLPLVSTMPADAPVRTGAIADGGESFAPNATKQATVVVIGTVQQVLPARWNTPDGGRPANPHSWESKQRDTIYTPVLVQVEAYLKGTQPQPRVFIFSNGGVVGQDSVTYGGRGNRTFREGERVVVFLNERVPSTSQGTEPAVDGVPLWNPVSAHYVVASDGLATDGFRAVPLQQLLAEIAAAQQQR